MANGRTGGGSIAEDVVFSNFGEAGLGDNDDIDDLQDDLGDDNDLGDDDGDTGDDDGLDDLSSRQDDRDDLGELTERQRQRTRGRDQFGRPRRDQRRQQQQRQRDPADQILDDLGVTHTSEQAPKTKLDKQGNVVNAQTGAVLARSGREARYYMNADKFRGQVAQANGRVKGVETRLGRAINIANSMNTELEAFRGREAQIKQLNIKPEDQLLALNLYKGLQDNPAQTIKTILTRAMARGITMDQIGLGQQNASGAMDPKTLSELIKEQIENAMKPVNERIASTNQRDNQQEQVQKIQNDANREVATFFDANPQARQYMKVFHGMIGNPQFQGMSLREMWAEIRINLMRQRQERPRGGQRNATNMRGRMPTGQRGPGGYNNNNNRSSAPDASYDSILGDIMDELGVK